MYPTITVTSISCKTELWQNVQDSDDVLFVYGSHISQLSSFNSDSFIYIYPCHEKFILEDTTIHLQFLSFMDIEIAQEVEIPQREIHETICHT